MSYLTPLVKRMMKLRKPDSQHIALEGPPPVELSPTQTMFVKWNAERLNVSLEESRARFLLSWTALRGGHAGPDYRRFAMLSHRLLQVFFNDCEQEVLDAYRLHSPTHFLRMLSYPDAKWDDQDVVVQRLGDRPRLDILDYGCGLAQSSRGLGRHFLGKGVPVHLFLVDISTLRKEFLTWLGKELGMETTFIESTAPSEPVSDLPPSDICFAQEFFEHVYHPARFLEAIHVALKPRGILVTNISDHDPEFMHVSPRLSELRAGLRDLGYDELRPQVVYQKSA